MKAEEIILAVAVVGFVVFYVVKMLMNNMNPLYAPPKDYKKKETNTVKKETPQVSWKKEKKKK